jgi:hypothetical protein
MTQDNTNPSLTDIVLFPFEIVVQVLVSPIVALSWICDNVPSIKLVWTKKGDA